MVVIVEFITPAEEISAKWLAVPGAVDGREIRPPEEVIPSLRPWIDTSALLRDMIVLPVGAVASGVVHISPSERDGRWRSTLFSFLSHLSGLTENRPSSR